MAVRYEDTDRTRVDAFTASTVLRALLALRAQVQELRRHSRDLEDAFGAGVPEMSLAAIAGVHRVFALLTVSYARLRTPVVAFDGAVFGEAVESFGELAIRSQRLVITAQLQRLENAIGRSIDAGAAGAARAKRVLTTFDTVQDLMAFTHAELARIDALWLPHRKASQAAATLPASCTDEARLARYRAAVRDAQRALTALVDEPRMATFLRAGALSRHWPEVQSACSMLAIALQVDLATEPDLSLLTRMARDGATDGQA